MEAQNVSGIKAPGLPSPGRQAAGGPGAPLRRIPALNEREFDTLMAQAIKILGAFEEAEKSADPCAARLVDGLAEAAVKALLAAWGADSPPLLWGETAEPAVSPEVYSIMGRRAFVLPVVYGNSKVYVIVNAPKNVYYVMHEGTPTYQELERAFKRAGLSAEPALEVKG